MFEQQIQPQVEPTLYPPGRHAPRRPVWPWLVAIFVAIGATVGITLAVVFAGGKDGPSGSSPSNSPTATATVPTTAQAAPTEAPTPEMGYAPAPGDFALEVVILEQKCFGSAGCNVTFRVTVTYLGAVLPESSQTFTAVYDVHGGSEPMTDRFTITGSQVSVPSEQMIQTDSPSTVLTAVVTRTL